MLFFHSVFPFKRDKSIVFPVSSIFLPLDNLILYTLCGLFNFHIDLGYFDCIFKSSDKLWILTSLISSFFQTPKEYSLPLSSLFSTKFSIDCIPPGFVITKLFGDTQRPAPVAAFPETYLPLGAILDINFNITDLATPGSPTSKTCISPLVEPPSDFFFLTPPNICKRRDSFILSNPYTLGAMLCDNFLNTFGLAANSNISFISSSLISSSSKDSSKAIVLFASKAISNLVEIPVGKGTGTSFNTPKILILLPGVLCFSILGSTKSSFKKTVSLLGCSPPSNESGDSSITNL